LNESGNKPSHWDNWGRAWQADRGVDEGDVFTPSIAKGSDKEKNPKSRESWSNATRFGRPPYSVPLHIIWIDGDSVPAASRLPTFVATESATGSIHPVNAALSHPK
jgi:hypothetical protein